MSRTTRIEGANYEGIMPYTYHMARDSCSRSHITALRNWARLGLVRLKKSLLKIRMPGERNLDGLVEARWPRWLERWWCPAGPYQASLNGASGPEADLGTYTVAHKGDWGRAEAEPTLQSAAD